MENLEIPIGEIANLDSWEYTHFYSKEGKTNILHETRQIAADLQLFKSDFKSGIDYFSYLILKREQLDERNERHIKHVKYLDKKAEKRRTRIRFNTNEKSI